MKHLLFTIILLFLFSFSARKNGDTKPYKAGFKIIKTIDKSRIYKPNTDTTNYLHYRPLDIDIWYPSITSGKGPALLFKNLLGLLDERANYYTASNAGAGLSQQIAQLFITGFKCSDTTRL